MHLISIKRQIIRLCNDIGNRNIGKRILRNLTENLKNEFFSRFFWPAISDLIVCFNH